jgi:hypothetical protein
MSNPLDPQSKVHRDRFYEAAMQPDFPDEMAFQLDRVDPSDPLVTFSQEGVNELAEQFRMFLMARIVGHGQKDGAMPKHMRATVKLDWNPEYDPIDDPDVGPYFHIDTDDGLTPLDHTRRHVWRT